MGLDQYLYKINKDISVEEYENKMEEFLNKRLYEDIGNYLNETHEEEIGYWRNEIDLDKYITDIYYEKGGTKKFNCKYVELNSDDIHDIIRCFYNHKDIVDVFSKALGYINKGYKIWYSNWW